MKRSAPLARTSITLPERQLAAADQIAAQLDRSRSWVFAEAIRRWAEPVAGSDGGKRAPMPGPVDLPSPTLPPAIEPAAALRLSPVARLRTAQDLMAAFRREHPRPTRVQIIAFESESDFLDWKAVP